MIRRIGVLGGTFDPIHIGHLVAARLAQEALELDSVLFVVANRPWQKADERVITPAEDRYAMVQAAVADTADFVASRMEIDRGGDTYTIDTVVSLRHQEPETEWVLIVGVDVAESLTTWHQADQLLELVTIAVVEREHKKVSWPDTARVELVPMESIDVSSTQIRQRVARGQDIRFLVPDAVRACITERKLYSGSR